MACEAPCALGCVIWELYLFNVLVGLLIKTSVSSVFWPWSALESTLSSLVAVRHSLRGLSAVLPGYKWRWHRRSSGDPEAARLPRGTGNQSGVDRTLLPLAHGRFRLRHR